MVSKKVETFPDHTCGTCVYCGFNPLAKKKDELLCFVNPAEFLYVDEDDQHRFHRGTPIMTPYMPACRFFSPRLHA